MLSTRFAISESADLRVCGLVRQAGLREEDPRREVYLAVDENMLTRSWANMNLAPPLIWYYKKTMIRS